MIRTGIPVTVWETEGWAVINTAIDVLTEADDPEQRGVDVNDPSTVPESWR